MVAGLGGDFEVLSPDTLATEGLALSDRLRVSAARGTGALIDAAPQLPERH